MRCSTYLLVTNHRRLLVVPLLWLIETEAFGHQPAVSQIADMAAQALRLEQTGKFEEALPLRQKAYDLSVRVYGDEGIPVYGHHPDTLTELSHLAEAYRKVGQLAKALPLLKEAGWLAEVALGWQHPDTQALYLSTAATIFDLASADETYAKDVDLAYYYLSTLYQFEERGRNWVSNELLSAVLEKAIRNTTNAVWAENESVLKGMYDLAMDHFDLNRLADALPWLERVQKSIEAREDRWSAGQSLTDLPTIYVVLGRPADALPLQEMALKRRIEIYGADDPRIAASLDDLAATYLDLGNRTEALRQQEKVLRLYKQLKSDHRLYEFDDIMRRYASMGRLKDFISRFSKVLMLKTETLGETHPLTLINLYDLASDLVYASGRLAEAKPLVVPLLEKATDLPSPSDVESIELISRIFVRLAAIYAELDRLPDALQVAEKGRKLASESLGNRHRQTIISLGILSDLNFEDNRPDQGLTLLEQALELETEVYGERNPNNKGVSIRSHLAYKYLEFGYASKALPLAKKELSLSTNYYERKYNLRILAEVFLALNRPTDALPLLQERLYMERKDNSINAYEDVVSIVVGGQRVKGEPRTLIMLAATYLLLGRTEEAKPLFEEVLKKDTAYEITPNYASQRVVVRLNTLEDLNRLADQVGQNHPSAAIPLLDKLVETAEHLRKSNNLSAEDRQAFSAKWVPKYKRLAALYVQHGQAAPAFRIAELAKARTLLESATTRRAIQRGVLSSEDRAQVEASETTLQALDNAIGQHREQGRALEDLLIQKERVAQDLGWANWSRTVIYPRYGQLSNPSIIEAEAGQALLPADAALLSYLFQDDELVVFVLTGEGLTAKTLTVPHLEETLRVYRGLLSRRQYPTKLTLDDAWKPIWPVWRMTDGSYTAAKEPPEGAQPGLGLEEIARYLAEQLLMPVLDNLQGKRHWIIAPDGPLLSLPFETLQLGEQLAVAQHDLSYAHSLSMYAMVQARAQEYAKLSGRKSLLAVGAAQYQPSRSWTERGRQLWMDLFAAWGVGDKGQTPAPPNTQHPVKRAELAELVMRGGDHGVADAFKRLDRKWPNIPSALEEIQTVARPFPDAALYTGESATEAQLQALNQTQALAQYRYLLLATHGFLHPDYPFLNAIVLGQLHNPPGTDGYVTASEWAGYRLQSDLMVLSACETGLGEVVPGEGILGLPFAMYVAGNTNVVMSLWKVFDRSTADFMARFFEKLKMGVSQVRALNDTKREFLADRRYRDYRRPVFWAPFVLYGA